MERNFGGAVARLDAGRSDRIKRPSLLGGTSAAALGAASLAFFVGVAISHPASADTVNPTQSTTYSLTTANNPITFGASTNISTPAGVLSAVYGGPAANWTVTNQGVIQSSEPSSAAMSLINGGVVTNQTGGTISGGLAGIYAKSGLATVTNAGRIAATTTNGAGVALFVGGSVINQAGGVLTADGTGVYAKSGAGTVTNAGSIIGTGTISSGVALYVGGVVTNAAGGLISGVTSGVFSKTGATTVTNAGTISASARSAIGVELLHGGSVNNQAGGVISGSLSGVSISGYGDVTNAGAILASPPPSAIYATTGVALGLQSTLTNSGTIAATGLRSSGVETGGVVVNQAGGVISGGDIGVYDRIGAVGGITNAGTITGGFVGAAAFSSLENQAGGTIQGADIGVDVFAGGSVTNDAGATISGGRAGVLSFSQYGPPTSTTVTNAGVIVGSDPSGFYFSAGVSLYGGGSVINKASGSINASEIGVYMRRSGAVTNAGTITGTGAAGVVLFRGGAVTNYAGATISGGFQGVYTGGGFGYGAQVSAVTNAGTIRETTGGGRYFLQGGVVMIDGGQVTNQSGGVITGIEAGVVTGAFASPTLTTVTNAGTIMATGTLSTGVSVIGGGYVVNQAGGVISGQGYGVFDGGTFTKFGSSVTNAGTISGGVDSVAFFSGGANSLILQTGSTLIGDALGSTASGATNALILQGAGTANNNFVNFNTLDVTAGGVWALNGVSAIGATTVESGNLRVGDASHTGAQLTSAVTINPGATLSGHGTVVGDVSNNGGTVSPGGSIGTLTINGNLTQSSTSTLAVEVTPTSNSNLVVTGTAALGGALVLNADAGSYRKGTTYTVLTAGSATGSFSSLSATGGLQISEANTSNTGVVTLLNGVFHSAGATPNETSVGNALVSVPVGATDFDTVANAAIALTPGAQQNQVMDQLGGEIDADFVTIGRDSARAFLGGIGDQLSAAGEAHAGGGDDRDPWVRAYGSLGNLDGDTNAHGLLSTSGGAMAGASRGWHGATVGAALSYGHTDLNLRGLNQKGSFDTGALALYGEQRMGVFFFDAAGSIAYDHGDSTRTILFPGIARRPTGGFDGYTGALTTAAGARLQGRDNLLFEPSVSLTYSHVSQSSFDEKGGGGADLLIGSKDQDALESLVQGKISKPFTLSNGNVLRADFKLGWDHEWTPTGTNITEAFAATGGIPFNVAGATPDHDRGIVGAGLAYDASKRMTWYGRYEMTLGQHQDDNALTAGFRFVW